MSASDVRPKIRADLIFSRVVERGQALWMIKDPLASHYLKLDELSGTIAQQMDGRRSIDQLVAWANAAWPGIAFDADYIADAVREFGKLRMLDDPFARSTLVLEKARRERGRLSLATFRNVMQINLGVFDPNRFLERTHHRIAFLYRREVVLASLALFVLSCLVLWARRDHLGFSIRAFFLLPGASPAGVALLWVILLLTTVGHEFGHAYTLKHWGGSVNRMGVMLMFGLPCLYTDTSDCHLFSNWTHKIYVALGGIYYDIIQAVAATTVWWATADGTYSHDVAARVMLFCGVTGILMNANPLVKLDGYYVAAEYLEMPELREQAFGYAGYLIKRYILRIPLACPVAGRVRKRILLLFVSLAFIYSATLMYIFYSFVRGKLIGWLAFPGAVLSVVLLYYFYKRPIRHVVRTSRLWVVTHRRRLGRRRMAWGTGVAAFVLFAALVPLPNRLTRTVVLEPAAVRALRAPDELVLRDARFRAGLAVRAGDTLAVLDGGEFAADAQGLSRRASADERTASAAATSGDAGAWAAASALGRSTSEQAALAAGRAERAVLRAPFDGRVLSLAALDRVGERLEGGDTVCVVGDVRRVRAGLVADETDVVDLQPSARVRARLTGDPGVVLKGRVAGTDWEPLEGRSRPGYRVWLDFDAAGHDVRPGQTAVVHVTTPSRTLAAMLARSAARWVRADLLL